MKYKVGDRVRIKSLDWYNENKDENGSIVVSDLYFFNGINKHLCGTIITITNVHRTCYEVKENDAYWTDEMIEGLVEEPVLSAPNITEGVFVPEKDMKWVTEYILPDGYIFKDENGNVINATKIVLEKKKNEYPKTYEECCKVFGLNHYLGISWNSYDEYSGVITCLPKRIEDIAKKLESLSKLLICRDAYWKIAGDELELGKPWEPDYKNPDIDLYVIINSYNRVEKAKYGYGFPHCTFTFPTEEMRDDFKKNFDPDIEICKELL